MPERKLRPYAEVHAERAAAQAERPTREPSGVACSEMVKETVTEKRTRKVARQVEVPQDPKLNPETLQFESRPMLHETVEDDVEYEVQVSRIVGPCPGEMMFVIPRETHPQLKNVDRAVCSECGWKGWV